VIRLTDPTRIGPALAEVRELQMTTRRQIARQLAEVTGRSETSLNAQLWTWDVGTRKPDLASLGTYLAALGYDLALIPREDAEPQPREAETHSWRHFNAEQADSYWIRCTLQGPHDEHEDANTGLTWRSNEESA
jgi:hypothetical protein